VPTVQEKTTDFSFRQYYITPKKQNQGEIIRQNRFFYFKKLPQAPATEKRLCGSLRLAL